MTVSELANILKTTPQTVRIMAQQGKMSAYVEACKGTGEEWIYIVYEEKVKRELMPAKQV